MTDSTYTIPAMRDTAETLRSKAAALVAEAEIQARQLVQEAQREADDIRRGAAEIDATADRLKAEQDAENQPAEQPCQACGLPMVNGPLGWQHQDPYAPCHLGQVVQPVPGQVLSSAPAQDGGTDR